MLKKVLNFYTKYFAVWVITFGVVAYFWPEVFLTLEEKMAWFFAATIERILPRALRLEKGMNWFFALTMFGIGAVLQIEDFKRIAKRPVIVLIGSAAQFSIMPIGSAVVSAIDAGLDFAFGKVEAGNSFLGNGIKCNQNGYTPFVHRVWSKALFKRKNRKGPADISGNIGYIYHFYLLDGNST